MIKRILFVVHRFYPFPGGSEIYVYNMAKELLTGSWTFEYDVTVLTRAGGNLGDIELPNGQIIKTTSDFSTLGDKFDLIVVHGGDVDVQNVVHYHAGQLPSPVLYMIIKPSESPLCVNGVQKHDYIGYSTFEDMEYCNKYNVAKNRYKYMPHGIPILESLGDSGRFFDKYGPNLGVLYVSAGGFWPHKGFEMTQYAFHKAQIFTKPYKSSLFLFGYSDHTVNAIDENVHIIKNPSHDDVLDAIAAADTYIMNSAEEGFGLVLLESQVNYTPWIGTNIAGARLLSGTVYDVGDNEALQEILQAGVRNISEFSSPDPMGRRADRLNNPTLRSYRDDVVLRHSMRNTCNTIEQIMDEQSNER